jgi:glycosyltransferase involved in cell wall biosynthesis
MKEQLVADFGVSDSKVSVIPFGINSTSPETTLSREHARGYLKLTQTQKALLFFGNIAPYKGLEYAVLALAQLRTKWPDVRLIIAGRIKGSDEYWNEIQSLIKKYDIEGHVIKRLEHIPENEVEVYFKAADVLILPYKFIFQSGVLFLSYNFGLPVIASNVGQMDEYIVEGKTGYIFLTEDCNSLVAKIDAYFCSDLYQDLSHHRQRIIDYAKRNYSWEEVGKTTCLIYERILR